MSIVTGCFDGVSSRWHSTRNRFLVTLSCIFRGNKHLFTSRHLESSLPWCNSSRPRSTIPLRSKCTSVSFKQKQKLTQFTNLQAYGAPGVVKIIRILEREIITGMRLLGAAAVDHLRPEMVGVIYWNANRFLGLILCRLSVWIGSQ